MIRIVNSFLLISVLVSCSLNTTELIAKEKLADSFASSVAETGKESLELQLNRNKGSLDAFISIYIDENSTLRVKNAKNLYNKVLESPKTDLLFDSIYKTLGYKNRNISVSMPPELSSHGFKGNQELLTRGLITSLENTFALLDSTLQRINYIDDTWIEPTVRKNLILNAIHTWYRNSFNNEYVQVLDDLNEKSLIKLKNISKNRFNLEKKLWNQTQIELFGLREDTSALSQYFLLENSKIYLNTGFQTLPNKSQLLSLQLNQQKFCPANPEKFEPGVEFLTRSFPKEMQQINSSDIDDKKASWTIYQVSQKLAKRSLIFSNKSQMKSAVHVLTDLVLEKILLLNQRRLNQFLAKPDSFFHNEKQPFYFQSINVMQTSLYEISELVLVDYLLASERTAFANLIIHRQCGLNGGTQEPLIKLSEMLNNQYTENLNIKKFTSFSQKRIKINNGLKSLISKKLLNNRIMVKKIDLIK